MGLSIPIVALTANAMKGDEEKCRAAGCSAFVAKPVDIDELMRCLAEQLKAAAGPSQERTTSVAPQLGAESRVDPAKFVRFVKEQLNAMHFALQHGQFATLAQLADWLKQTADASGHGEFHSMALRIEELAEEETVAGIEDAICELAILSESIALGSHEPVERPAGSARKEAAEAGPSEIRPIAPAAPTASGVQPAHGRSRLPADRRGLHPAAPRQAVAMQAAWERKDLDELARLSHWLKGAGGTVGFDALTEPGKEVGTARQAETSGRDR